MVVETPLGSSFCALHAMRAWTERDVACLLYRLNLMKVPKARLDYRVATALEAFAFFVLLCIWHPLPDHNGRAAHLESLLPCDALEAFQWMELFAGCRSATTAVGRAGYSPTCIDINDVAAYGLPGGVGSAFDILSDSGFVWLDLLCCCAGLSF